MSNKGRLSWLWRALAIRCAQWDCKKSKKCVKALQDTRILGCNEGWSFEGVVENEIPEEGIVVHFEYGEIVLPNLIQP